MKKLRKKFRFWIDKALRGTHNHYLCRLPDRMDYISSMILKLYFSGISVPENHAAALKKLHETGIVVYASKYKRNFEYLFYHTRYKQQAYPYPEIGLDFRVILWQPLSQLLRITLAVVDFFCFNLSFPNPYKNGYIQQELHNGRVALLSLVDKRSFYRRFVKSKIDPVQYLIEMQKNTTRPIFIVPQLVFFDKNPERSVPSLFDVLFGSKGEPGKIRRFITLMMNPKHVFVEVSEPLNLQEFLALPQYRDQSIEQLALVLRRKLVHQINRHRQSITGPMLKSREELKESILTSDRLRHFMNRYSKSRKIPLQEVHKEADGYLEEIAANYNTGYIRIGSVILKKLFGHMFEEVSANTESIARIKAMSLKGPVIFLPCHKSHIDYLILSYILYNNNMPCPHIAAGKNLAFWPIGSLFRASGAFFIRRSFMGAMLYSKVFKEYFHKLLEEGFNVEFFLEGTRSRTGKMIMPKLGLLSLVLEAFRNGACEDLIVVPVFIGYDQVLEEGAYLEEIEGGQKKPENFLQVVKARRFLKRRHGRIYVQFHDPLSIKDLLATQGTTISDMTAKEQNAFCRNLAYRVFNAIDSLTIVTPHALFSSTVLNCANKKFSLEQLMFHWETYLNCLKLQGAFLETTLRNDHHYTVERLLDTYLQQKFIEKISEEKDDYAIDTLYKMNDTKRPILEYYKNNCITLFIPTAFTALAILEKDTFQFSVDDISQRYRFLQNLFKNEFVYHVNQSPEDDIRRSIDAFIRDGMIQPHPGLPDTYNLTSTGLRKLKVHSSFLKTYFESYWIVLKYFMRYPQNSVDAKERLKRIQTLGNRMFKRSEIELKEALSKVNYDNAIMYFTTHGIKGAEDTDKIEFYADEIQKSLNHLST